MSVSDSAPSVELSGCAVRFLVPHDLAYVHTDATAQTRDRIVPLAVWAFREADRVSPHAADLTLDIGGQGRVAAAGKVDGSGVESALALTEEILLDGIVHSGPALASSIARVRRDLDVGGVRWPLLALDDLDDQLRAYADRGARYQAERAAYVIAELHARHRAGVAGADSGAMSSLRSRVLGTEEAANIPLRRLRLTSLGCRVSVVEAPGEPAERVVEVFLAHPDSAMTLVLRRRWPVPDGEAPTGHDLLNKRIGGVPLWLLASGDIVSESAVRSASRTVRLITGRIAMSTATTFSDNWGGLPNGLLVRDLGEETRAMAELPPRLIRPRIEAEFVRAVAIASVCSVGYLPGDQRMEAVIEDEEGTPATISATYRSVCPGALGALASALTGERGKPRYVSGTLRRARGASSSIPWPWSSIRTWWCVISPTGMAARPWGLVWRRRGRPNRCATPLWPLLTWWWTRRIGG